MRVFVLAFGLLCGLAANAAAERPNGRREATAWCATPARFSYEQIIAGCSWIIDNPLPFGSPVNALRSRAMALADTGRLQEALADLTTAVQLSPRDVELQTQRGSALLALDRPVEAADAFTAALVLRPRHADALFGKAIALSESYQLEAAMVAIEAALDAEPAPGPLLGMRRAELLALRAQTRIRQGNREAAMADLDRLLERVGSHESALQTRATNRLAIGDFSGALSDAQKAAETWKADNADAQATICLAKWRMTDPQFQASCEAALNAARTDGTNGWAFAVVAGIALAEGRPGDALLVLDEALATRPGNGFALYLRGVARRRMAEDGTQDLAAGLARLPVAAIRAREFFGETIGELP
jgi:tetratricopeptide (TPR) repeat protein